MPYNQRNKIIVVVILSVIFGLAGGIVGEIVSRAYLFEDAFKIPFFGEIYFSENSIGGSDLVIRGARKVIVEQDTKVKDTVGVVKNSIVGIYKKQSTSTLPTKRKDKKNGININNYYQLNKQLAQGFIISSDGWVMTDYFPSEYIQLLNEKNSKDIISKVIKDYIIISKDRVIYQIDNIIIDEQTDYYFFHIKAQDLPIRKFAQKSDINKGQLVLAVNWQELVWLTNIIGFKNNELATIKSSDKYLTEIILLQKPTENFYNSFIFNLSGDLIGLINKDGDINLINNYTKAIESLFQDKKIIRPSLGVNYIDLSNLVNSDPVEKKGALIVQDENGVAIEKGSSAQAAGLKDGDMITYVNNIEINKDNELSHVISQFLAGEKVSIEILRNEKKQIIDVILGEL